MSVEFGQDYQFYEFQKIAEYAHKLVRRGYRIIKMDSLFSNDRRFDLVVQNKETKKITVFEFKSRPTRFIQEKLEKKKIEAEVEFPNSDFQVVYCIEELEKEKSIEIDWILPVLNEYIITHELEEIKKNVQGFFRLSDNSVKSLEIFNVNVDGIELNIKGEAYIQCILKVRDEEFEGELQSEPILFEFELIAKNKFSLFLPVRININSTINIKWYFEKEVDDIE